MASKSHSCGMGGLASFGLERFEDESVGGTKTLVTRGMVPSAHCTGLESLRSMATGWVVRCGDNGPARGRRRATRLGAYPPVGVSHPSTGGLR